MAELYELSDLIVDYDPETLARRPVDRTTVVARLRASGQRAAARLAARLPVQGDQLDPEACDRMLLRAHTELQRLSEELLQADRARQLLVPMLQALRAAGVAPPLRVVDVGCGLGYLVRALAAHGRLGRDVQLIGCDMNRGLVEAARRLAERESLSCDFRVANAFTLAEPAHLFVSTGVVHHFRGRALESFFAGQREAYGFLHHDMQRSAITPLGSWIFHRARMREPLARHDGVVSAQRAHSADDLLAAARAATGFRCAPFDRARTLFDVLLHPMHALVGTRPQLWDGYLAALGPLRSRLDAGQRSGGR
jgi:SAM-dependent methyltransferase